MKLKSFVIIVVITIVLLTSCSVKIAEVLVAEGDAVEADHIVTRLKSSETMQAEVAHAELEVLLAEQTLADLYDHSDSVQADPANVQAVLDKAIAVYEAAGQEPDEDLVTVAEARLSTARAALVAAQAANERLVLRVPFAGVLTGLSLKAGEFATAGQPNVTAADLAARVIETEGLTELDVVKLRNGQPASISGDITCRVTICLNDVPDEMCWGMAVQAKTFTIVTHDNGLAERVHRTMRIADGEIISDENHLLHMAALPHTLVEVS